VAFNFAGGQTATNPEPCRLFRLHCSGDGEELLPEWFGVRGGKLSGLAETAVAGFGTNQAFMYLSFMMAMALSIRIARCYKADSQTGGSHASLLDGLVPLQETVHDRPDEKSERLYERLSLLPTRNVDKTSAGCGTKAGGRSD